MNCQKINRTSTPFFSNLANDLVYNQKKLSDFIQRPCSIENFATQLKDKAEHYSAENREVLVKQLKKQYEGIHDSITQKQLNLLEEPHTFTVTTGHQLNLFTGPLYFIYKIFHVVKLAESLKKAYPTHNFVPVYWMASEDHDFEEINHFHLFQQRISWETEQGGAVGRFEIKEFEEVRNQLRDKFRNDADYLDWMLSFYKDGQTLAQATFHLVHELLGKYGVLILDADRKELKSLFIPIFKKEISEEFSSLAVENTSEKLVDKGYKTQVHPREINLFYLEKNKRSRIIYTNDKGYQLGDEFFTQEETLELIDNYPERFSPNVVLRPVYQEVILPNLCYVGGGGEMAYWLQLKGVFDTLNVPYPLLQVRNSIQLIDSMLKLKMDKLNLKVEDLFMDINQIKKSYALNNASVELDFSLIEDTAKELATKMEELIEEADKGLIGYAKSESVKIKKQVDTIKQKLIRHEKKKQETAMKQIDQVWQKSFPGNGLQERKENVFEWMAKSGKGSLDQWYEFIDPFEKDLMVLIEK